MNNSLYNSNPYAYSNPYQTSYSQNTMNSMNNMYRTQQPSYQLPQQEVLKVNGENGMNTLVMSPNSSVLALDINKPILWFAQTDGAGYKTVNAYQIIPIDNSTANGDINIEQVINQLDSRISKLEGVFANGQSNTATNAKKSTKSKSNDASNATS